MQVTRKLQHLSNPRWMFAICLAFYTSWTIYLLSSHLACYGGEMPSFDAPLYHTVRNNANQSDVSGHPQSQKARGSSLPPYVLSYNGPTTTWNKQPFPCFPGETDIWANAPIMKGFLYTKPLKSASSTLSGIAVQAAYNMARRLNVNTSHCLVRWNHATPSAKTMKYNQLVKSDSYLFTFVREPTKRAISNFFFDEVSRFKKEPHDVNFKKYMLGKATRNHYIQEMSPSAGLVVGSQNSTISQILNMYDFIGIVERFDESLVVLKLLLGLEYHDILYLSAKSSGAYDDGVSFKKGAGLGWDVSGEQKKGTCVYIVPSFVSPGMKEWLNSSAWQNQISGDNALYAAAYQSLDSTIEQLGPDLVSEQLNVFKRYLAVAQETCASKTVLPCSASGVRTPNKKTSCIVADSGCGYECFYNLTLNE